MSWQLLRLETLASLLPRTAVQAQSKDPTLLVVTAAFVQPTGQFSSLLVG